MEAIAENIDVVTVLNSTSHPAKSQDLNKVDEYNEIHLDQADYDYLIQWKRDRADLERKRSTLFFFIGLTLALTAVIVAFEWNFPQKGIIDDLLFENTEWEEIQDIPQTYQAPPPPPKQLIQQPVIVEVPDEEILEEIEVDMDVEITEDMAVAEIEFTEEDIPEEKAEEIFMIVEDEPTPKGGLKAFYEYVSKNIRYPQRAMENEIEGRVYVQFVVNSKGKINDVNVMKGIGAGCDEEAARIIKDAPDWNPGKQRGKPVSVRMVVPITFKLQMF